MFQPALEVFEHLISSSPACCRSSLGTWNWTFGQPIDIGWNFRRLELGNARWATDHNWPNAAMQMTFRLKWCFVLHHVASIAEAIAGWHGSGPWLCSDPSEPERSWHWNGFRREVTQRKTYDLWYPTISYDILWYTTMIYYYDILLWYPMISYDILWYTTMISYDILRYPMKSYDALKWWTIWTGIKK